MRAFFNTLLLRNQKVLLDTDLAELYGVTISDLVQAVKRNVDRFPEDFMFQLDALEWANLRSQSVISSSKHGGRRYAPYAISLYTTLSRRPPVPEKVFTFNGLQVGL